MQLVQPHLRYTRTRVQSHSFLNLEQKVDCRATLSWLATKDTCSTGNFAERQRMVNVSSVFGICSCHLQISDGREKIHVDWEQGARALVRVSCAPEGSC